MILLVTATVSQIVQPHFEPLATTDFLMSVSGAFETEKVATVRIHRINNSLAVLDFVLVYCLGVD